MYVLDRGADFARTHASVEAESQVHAGVPKDLLRDLGGGARLQNTRRGRAAERVTFPEESGHPNCAEARGCPHGEEKATQVHP